MWYSNLHPPKYKKNLIFLFDVLFTFHQNVKISYQTVALSNKKAICKSIANMFLFKYVICCIHKVFKCTFLFSILQDILENCEIKLDTDFKYSLSMDLIQVVNVMQKKIRIKFSVYAFFTQRSIKST